MKINLLLKGTDVLVFDINDWYILRNHYRIIGELIGNSNHIPVLPLKLLPEEVEFLLGKKIAKLVYFKAEQNYEDDYESNLLEEQILLYKNNRRKQLENMVDKIVASKRKRGDLRTESEILDDELEKSCQVNGSNMIWPISLMPHKLICEEIDHITYQHTNHLRCAVFQNLWERGYYITSGQKFGGDFLVYLGDPIIYHAIFIVRCVDNMLSMDSHEIVAFGRLGTSVKKKTVLASLINEQVSFITLNWIDD
ncbi:hypothetical protein HHI36_001894 [Cryptolaemus montrouzieri]|uniref:tRNA-intron lyase n=1 Tax=Cryptolaemus montrouzieri TaxID=559131 RepID=A0ABD2P8T5_9CUCU